MTFGDREFTEPSTVFGPNVAKAKVVLGEFWGATVILYELAPENLVHRRIADLVVTENMDTWISDERDDRSGDQHCVCLHTLRHGFIYL